LAWVEIFILSASPHFYDAYLFLKGLKS
jgi:hypothetical protein